MWYLPPASLLQSATALSYDPPGSLKTYQLMAFLPPPPSVLPIPHAVRAALAVSAMTTSRCRACKLPSSYAARTPRRRRLIQRNRSCVRREPAGACRAGLGLYTQPAAERHGLHLGGRVDRDGVGAAPECDDALRGVEQLEALAQLAPQRDQLADQREHRGGVVALVGDVA